MFDVNVDKIRLLLLVSGESLRVFARRAGLHYLTIRRIINGEKLATAHTVSRLASAFGVNPKEILDTQEDK